MILVSDVSATQFITVAAEGTGSRSSMQHHATFSRARIHGHLKLHVVFLDAAGGVSMHVFPCPVFAGRMVRGSPGLRGPNAAVTCSPVVHQNVPYYTDILSCTLIYVVYYNPGPGTLSSHFCSGVRLQILPCGSSSRLYSIIYSIPELSQVEKIGYFGPARLGLAG